jgi:hypothetical protein
MIYRVKGIDMSFIRTLFTTADNQSADIGRVLWCLLTVAFVLLSVVAVLRGQPFDPMNWTLGAGSLLALGGTALAIKHGTEPKT